VDRRTALQRIGTLAASVALEACASRHPAGKIAASALAPPPHLLHLPPVDVRPEREIRTICGLRPFRPSGYVVKAERFDDKLVVHNYGHGGAGMTLSWGTAEQASRFVDSSGAKSVAVLGCGGVGLATARLLQERGCAVTIYARELPPHTTSNVAGAQWFPFLVYEHGQEPPDFRAKMLEAARLANARYQVMVGARYGIRWRPNFRMDQKPMPSGGLIGLESPIRDLLPELHDLTATENPFPLPYVRQFDTMMIEPNIYLPAVMEDFRLAGGRIEVRELRSVAELQALPESVIVNCTGLGAGALFNDREIVPVKGQLTFLLPQPEIDYCTLGDGDLYMFPRQDGIALGGTHETGVWSLDPDLAAKSKVLAGQARIFSRMRTG
jgi:glycine/D-amino acid oxidase-like deaminating enzyme